MSPSIRVGRAASDLSQGVIQSALGTFMEHSKLLIDELNGFLYSRDNATAATAFTSSTNSMHFYEGMVVFERAQTARGRVCA